MMAAVLAEGTSVLKNAALEPEITDLIQALQACGVEIEGADTPRIVVHGTTSVKPLNTVSFRTASRRRRSWGRRPSPAAT